MKKKLVQPLAIPFSLLTSVIASDTGFEQEAPVSFSATGDLAALDAPSFSAADMDPLTKMQLSQKFLYQKVLENTHTHEEGLCFLELTKKLQENGADIVFNRNNQAKQSSAGTEESDTSPAITSYDRKLCMRVQAASLMS